MDMHSGRPVRAARKRRTATALGAVALLLMPLSAPPQAQMRPDVNGTRAAVTSGHPLASAAGADVLRRGGNAVDAAVTMAAVLAVVRPHMNGVGGDAFLIIRDAAARSVRVLNGSGRAGSGATPAHFAKLGLTRIPSSGPLAVSVPGAVRAWADALAGAGTITLAEALAPAIRYAEEGFPVSEQLAEDLASAADRLARDPALGAVFLVEGVTPRAGALLRQPDLAATLRRIAEHGAAEIYTGHTAGRIAGWMAREGGLVTAADLAAHTSTWQSPIATSYLGYEVAVLPPNSQGIALLMQMNLAARFDLRSAGHNTAPYAHTLVEIKKLAFRERDAHVADPAFADVPIRRLLSAPFTETLAEELAERVVAAGGQPGRDGDGDTVFLGAVDEHGNAVSMIQSLFSAFGSGRMVPGTGIVLHNRGSAYSLDVAHPNVVAPGKRPYHTLSPAMVFHGDGSLAMILGTPGADGQTQTLLQVMNNMVLFGMSPQRAVEAPRWRSYDDGRLVLEPGFAAETLAALDRLGHTLRLEEALSGELGGAQVIVVGRDGVLRTGADPRREAFSIAW